MSRDSAYAFVAATTFVAFVAYGIFATVTVLVFTKDGPKPEIVVLSRSLADSEEMRGCFIAYAIVDVGLRIVWETVFVAFSTGKLTRWLRVIGITRSFLFVVNPFFQILVGAFKMTEMSDAHFAMATAVTATFVAYLLLSLVVHVSLLIRNVSVVVSVGVAAEMLVLAITAVGLSCFLANACTGPSNVLTVAWYEYVVYTFVALMGAARTLDVALTTEYRQLPSKV